MPAKSIRPVRVAIYSRVSTDHQTTENQERELHAIADRMGWTVVKVYRDQGVSGAKSRENRPAFDAMQGRQPPPVRPDSSVVGRPAGPQLTGPCRLPDGGPRPRRQPVPASAGHRHHDPGR
jgi:hypothetical protein